MLPNNVCAPVALICLIVGMFATGSGVVAQSARDSKIFDARYAAMKAAMAAHDGPAIAKLLAPNFVSVSISGEVETGPQMIAQVSALPADPNKVSHTTIDSVNDQSGSTVVAQHYDMTTTKIDADGATHQIHLATKSTDTWVFSSGTWLLLRTETRLLDYEIDGKLVVHKLAAAQN